MTSRVAYSAVDCPRVVCVPRGGFPLERLRNYIERCQREIPFKPDEVKDLVQMLCNDALLSCLAPADQTLVASKIKPAVNSFLQREGVKIHKLRALRRTAN